MTRSPSLVALARAANAALFLGIAAFCFLACSPFAYSQLIQPSVVPALTDFVAVSPWLFVVALLVTTLTLMPQLRGEIARGRSLALAYVAAGAVAALLLFTYRPLASIGNSWPAFALGLAALVWPVSLSLIDHVMWPAPRLRSADAGRLLSACLGAGALSALAYAVDVPVRLARAVGVELGGRALAGAAAASIAADLVVFAALFLALFAAIRLGGGGAPPVVQFRLTIALLAALACFILYWLVCASIAFTGPAALAASVATAIAVAAVWAGLARLRAPQDGAIDAIELFTAPVMGRGGRRAATIVATALPVVALALGDAVYRLDWNFLLQKLGVLIVWLIAFSCAYALAGRHARPVSRLRLAGVPLLLLAVFQTSTAIEPRAAAEQYAAVDASFRLIRDARTVPSSGTAVFYRLLEANTLLAPPAGPLASIDFVAPLRPTGRKKPNIFLIVVDSLRRDYLTPYNARATFTPSIARLAQDSFVYLNAFTRYAGTALAVPSIWSGAMVPHMLDQGDFRPRNALLKLLDANGYHRYMAVDHVVAGLVPRDGRFTEVDVHPRSGIDDVDACRALDDVARELPARPSEPAFFYALPQNAHIAMATHRSAPAQQYPSGFFAPVAASVQQVDACLGRFIEFLRRQQLYDDSIVIVTSDHGDSLGEEGRWGHAYYMYPEVMRVPLIVHVPSWLAAGVRTDLDAVVFSTDLVPSLYALLGYAPADLGPLFGRPIFTPPDGDSSWRRRERFLLASSYGAVYGALSENGRRMFVVDAVGSRDDAFDLGDESRRVTITESMTAANRAFIARQLEALRAAYRYQP